MVTQEDSDICAILEIVTSNPNGSQMLNDALLKASGCGNSKLVKSLLKFGADPNTVDDKRRSPIHLAAAITDQSLSNQSSEIIEALVTSGGKVRTSTIHVVANVPALRALAKNGADPTSMTTDGMSALRIALINKRFEVVVELICRFGLQPDNEDLIQAVKLDNLEIVSLFLDKGCDANALDRTSRMTALQLAIENGSRGIGRILLQHGARIPEEISRSTCTSDDKLPSDSPLTRNSEEKFPAINGERISFLLDACRTAEKDGNHWTQDELRIAIKQLEPRALRSDLPNQSFRMVTGRIMASFIFLEDFELKLEIVESAIKNACKKMLGICGAASVAWQLTESSNHQSSKIIRKEFFLDIQAADKETISLFKAALLTMTSIAGRKCSISLA